MGDWSKFWKHKSTQPRIAIFLWKAVHGGLAVKNVIGRYLQCGTECKRCGAAAETIEHALLHCQLARQVWDKASIPLPGDFDRLNIASFIAFLLKESDPSTFGRGSAICWAIWIARNDLTFSDKTRSPEEILCHAYRVTTMAGRGSGTLEDSNIGEEVSTQLHSSSEPFLWRPPAQEIIKINVDGACKDGLMAGGAVARNYQGRFIACSYQVLGTGTPIEAEAGALQLGLSLLKTLGSRSACLEGDCKIITDCIHNPDLNCPWRISHLMEGWRREQQSSEVSFSCIPREGNSVAHTLAAHALEAQESDLWIHGALPPPFIMEQLQLDLINASDYAA